MPKVPQKSYLGRWRVQTVKEEVMSKFKNKLTLKLGNRFELNWDIDKKGVVWGWCRLSNPKDIYAAAEIVAEFKGRVMTISPLNTPADLTGYPRADETAAQKPVMVVINYHFFFEGINCTVTITLPDEERAVKSITPVLISADWHEREMQELYNIKLQGHPNPRKLFLDKNINFANHTMIPLSEALNGASTNTLWEKIMRSDRKEEDAGEQL